MSAKYMLTLYFDGSPTDKLTISNFASTSALYLIIIIIIISGHSKRVCLSSLLGLLVRLQMAVEANPQSTYFGAMWTGESGNC